MSCNNRCKLCNNIVISTAVQFDSENDQVVVTLPTATYNNKQRYCIIIAQEIPTDATISSQVVFNTGGSENYPFVNKCCENVLACQISTRRIYPTRVNANISSGVFRYIGNCQLPCTATTNTLGI